MKFLSALDDHGIFIGIGLLVVLYRREREFTIPIEVVAVELGHSLTRFFVFAHQGIGTDKIQPIVPKVWSEFDGLSQPRNRSPVSVCEEIRPSEIPIEYTERWVAGAKFYRLLDQRRRLLRAAEVDQFIRFLSVTAGEVVIEFERLGEGVQRRWIFSLRPIYEALCEVRQITVGVQD